MPPASTTMVWPRLTKPRAAACSTTLARLVRVANRSVRTAPVAQTSASSPTTTSLVASRLAEASSLADVMAGPPSRRVLPATEGCEAHDRAFVDGRAGEFTRDAALLHHEDPARKPDHLRQL